MHPYTTAHESHLVLGLHILCFPTTPGMGKDKYTSIAETPRPTVITESVRTVLLVIDEIGKMELFSREFVDVVQASFKCPNVVVMATIPIARQKSHWLVEELRCRNDCKLFEVSS